MEKMSAPKLEVITFNTEDVIVTSSNSAATNFIKATQLQGKHYFTSGSEVVEYYRWLFFINEYQSSNQRYQ